MDQRILMEVKSHSDFLFSMVPGSLGYLVRRWYLGRRLGSLGYRAAVGSGVLIIGARNIHIGSHFSCWRNCTLAACDDGFIQIGDRVGINANVYINACGGGKIVLGDDVLIAPNVVMRSNEHNTGAADRRINLQGSRIGKIIVERDVWIASNVTISGNVRIGHGAVVAAGAVVVRDVEPYTMVGGVPARFIRMRDENEGDRSADAKKPCR